MGAHNYHTGCSVATVPDIPNSVIGGHSSCMTVYQIRKANLLALVTQRGGTDSGGQSKLAEEINKSASQINQYCHKKPMGNGFARDIERGLHLVNGWMDRLHQGDDKAAPVRASVHGFSMRFEAAEFGAEWDKLLDNDERAARIFQQLLYVIVAKKVRDTRPKKGSARTPDEITHA